MRQPHWLILKCDVEKPRIHWDLEKTAHAGRVAASTSQRGELMGETYSRKRKTDEYGC